MDTQQQLQALKALYQKVLGLENKVAPGTSPEELETQLDNLSKVSNAQEALNAFKALLDKLLPGISGGEWPEHLKARLADLEQKLNAGTPGDQILDDLEALVNQWKGTLGFEAWWQEVVQTLSPKEIWQRLQSRWEELEKKIDPTKELADLKQTFQQIETKIADKADPSDLIQKLSGKLDDLLKKVDPQATWDAIEKAWKDLEEKIKAKFNIDQLRTKLKAEIEELRDHFDVKSAWAKFKAKLDPDNDLETDAAQKKLSRINDRLNALEKQIDQDARTQVFNLDLPPRTIIRSFHDRIDRAAKEVFKFGGRLTNALYWERIWDGLLSKFSAKKVIEDLNESIDDLEAKMEENKNKAASGGPGLVKGAVSGLMGGARSLLDTTVGKWVGLIGVVLGVIAILFALSSRPSRISRIPIMSFLEETKYIKELQLASYYTSEILMLGDPNRLEKLAEQAAADSLAAYKNIYSLEMKAGEVNLELAGKKKQQEDQLAQLEPLKERRDSAREEYEVLPATLKDFENELRSINNSTEIQDEFGNVIAKAWSNWQALGPQPAKRKPGQSRRDFRTDKRNWKNKDKKLNKDFKNAFNADKNRRLTAWQVLDKEYSNRAKKAQSKKLVREIEKLQKKVETTNQDLIQERNNLRNLSHKAVVADSIALVARSQDDEGLLMEDPKLLVIVPTRVSAFVDLEKMKPELVNDSTVKIFLDSIYLGRVFADLKTDERSKFNIAARKADAEETPSGLYHQIFEQIRMGLEAISGRVPQKALDQGIIQNSCASLEQFFQQRLNPLGFEVIVRSPSCPCNCEDDPKPPPPITPTDTTDTTTSDSAAITHSDTLSHDSITRMTHAWQLLNFMKDMPNPVPQTEAEWDDWFGIKAGTPVADKMTRNPRKKVMGWHLPHYGSAWKSYNFDLLWGVCYFSYLVDPTTGRQRQPNDWATTEMISKAQASDTKVLLSIASFGEAENRRFLNNEAAWNTLATNVIAMLRQRNADGVNLDFEGVGANDKEQFTKFIVFFSKKLKAANPNYLVTSILYAVDWHQVFDIKAIEKHVDLFTLMAYDYHGSWSKQAGPVAPLDASQAFGNLSVKHSVNTYVKRGVPKSKLVVGVPYYGARWITQNGEIPSKALKFVDNPAYKSIASHSLRNYEPTRSAYEVYGSPADSLSRQLWAKDVFSLRATYDYVNADSLAGISIWALGYDNGRTELWELLAEKFGIPKPTQ